MANIATFMKIKTTLRISHNKLNEDINDDIDACIADLRVVGITGRNATEDDPLIYNAIKLWCRSLYTDDPVKAAEWLKRYEALKACLQMAEGYGWEATADE